MEAQTPTPRPNPPVVYKPTRKKWPTWAVVLIALITAALGSVATFGGQQIFNVFTAQPTISAEQREIEDEKAELIRRDFKEPVLQDKLTGGHRVYSVKLSEGCFALITMMGGTTGPVFGQLEDTNAEKVRRVQCGTGQGTTPAGR